MTETEAALALAKECDFTLQPESAGYEFFLCNADELMRFYQRAKADGEREMRAKTMGVLLRMPIKATAGDCMEAIRAMGDKS